MAGYGKGGEEGFRYWTGERWKVEKWQWGVVDMSRASRRRERERLGLNGGWVGGLARGWDEVLKMATGCFLTARSI